MVMPAGAQIRRALRHLDGGGGAILERGRVFQLPDQIHVRHGGGFELPVVLLALVKIGLLDYAKLSAMRRYMIVGNLILGALLTTPEVFTQVCMAIALQVLYEISVWIAWYWERQEKRRAANSLATGG